jgi:hypothetical protein
MQRYQYYAFSNTNKESKSRNDFNFLSTGVVVSVDYNNNSVAVRDDNGTLYSLVQVLSRNYFENFIDYGANSTIEDTRSKEFKGTLNIFLPQLYSRVVYGFIHGKNNFPIIIGCLPDRLETSNRIVQIDESNKVYEEGRDLYLHPSHYWEKIEGNGNKETYFPDGTKISISDRVLDKGSELSYDNLYELIDEDLLEPKAYRIKHSTGTVVLISNTGEVTLDLSSLNDSHQTVTILSKNVIIEGSSILLGKDAAESLVKGDSFKTLYDSHIHMTGAGPSGQPTVLMDSTHLSNVSKTI